MTRNRFPAAVGLGVALVLVTAGCGAKPFPQAATPTSRPPATVVDGEQPPRARLLAAVQRVTAAKTARISLDMKITAAGSAVTVTGAGVVDVVRRRAQLTLDQTDTDDNDSTIEMRLIDGTVYINNDGEGWTHVSAAAASVSPTPDPTGYLDYLQGVADDVHVDGTAVVRGAYTTRYSATLDLERALVRSTTPAQRSALKLVVGIVGDLKIPTSVWIDASGQLRKVQMSIDLGAIATKLGLGLGVGVGVGAGADPKIDETFELYDFGVAVDVQAPAGAKDARTAALDRAAQSDLRNALTAEKTYYTDQEFYSADASILKQIEPSLDWGGKLSEVVGNGTASNAVVCLSERSKSGTTFALADVAYGTNAGTYYATTGCPSVVDEASFSGFGTHW